ncbi:MAG: GatB/YqeY domain-containing protein [Patescibacteria group bacterium]
MSLTEQIEQDTVSAMKARNQEKLDALRLVRAALKNEQITLGHALSDEESHKVLARLIKQRHEAADHFRKAGRTESADKEEREANLIGSYLPTQLTNAELTQIVDEVITTIGATSAADFGKVMGQVMARTKGQADGNVVSELVRQRLT